MQDDISSHYNEKLRKKAEIQKNKDDINKKAPVAKSSGAGIQINLAFIILLQLVRFFLSG